MDPVLPVLSLAEVKTLDQGPAPLYVLLLPEVPDPSSGVVLPEVSGVGHSHTLQARRSVASHPIGLTSSRGDISSRASPTSSLDRSCKRSFLCRPHQTTMLVWKSPWTTR